MDPLTPHAHNFISDISRRYNLSYDSAVSMLLSVNKGGGTMAQFYCPELGSGQWMRGGMTMVGDLFNHGLKNTVNNLCCELSDLLANHQVFPPASQGSAHGGSQWYPAEFGRPSSSGSQNNIRYAFFPQARRLVVERDGNVTIFDTLDHQISSVSQQQGGNTSLSFSSQYGTVSTLSLPLISGPGLQPSGTSSTSNFVEGQNAPAPVVHGSPTPTTPPSREAAAQNSHELLGILEKLGHLRDAGVLTEEEFQSKKTELLNRL